MTNIILLVAFVIRSVFFAPLHVIDVEPIGHCQLIHYSKREHLLRIPRCYAPGYEWAGAWRSL